MAYMLKSQCFKQICCIKMCIKCYISIGYISFHLMTHIKINSFNISIWIMFPKIYNQK